MTTLATTPDRIDDGFVHAALLYRGAGHRDAALEAFLRDAADAGEPVLTLLAPATLRDVGGTLARAGTTVDAHAMSHDGANPARLLGLLEEWLDGRSGAARVVSEPIWPERDRPEVLECLRHEALLNLTLQGRAVSVLCPYDAEHLDAEVLRGAELTHPLLIDEAGPRASLAYGDQGAAALGLPWPQDPPAEPVAALDFDGDLSALRRAVAGDERAAALPDERRSDLQLAVSEAAANAVRHGDGSCDVRLWRDGDRVVAQVSTSSAIEDPLAGRRRPDPAAADGRGLWLINQVCDLVELRNDADGASLRLHMRVDETGRASTAA